MAASRRVWFHFGLALGRMLGCDKNERLWGGVLFYRRPPLYGYACHYMANALGLFLHGAHSAVFGCLIQHRNEAQSTK
jgi:hypothetical protein